MLDKLGPRIRSARESAGFTQESLAELTGVSRTAVARWESGDIIPKLENLVNLALLLNVSTDYLLGITQAENAALSTLSDEAISALEKFIREVKSEKP